MSGLLTALKRQVIFPHTFIEIVFPNGTLRLFDGVGSERINGEVFYSRSDWGAILAQDAVERGIAQVQSGFSKTFFAGPLLLQAARNPLSEGSPIRVWIANIDPDAGPTDVTLDHSGFVNLATIQHEEPTTVTIEFVNATDYASDINELLTMTDAGQRLLDPDDKFCEFVNEVDRSLPWGGKDSPRPVLSGVVASTPGVTLGGGGVVSGAVNRFLTEQNT